MKLFLLIATALALAQLTPSTRAEAYLYFNNAGDDLHRSRPDGSIVTSPLANAIGANVGFLHLTHEFIYYSDRTANTLNRILLLHPQPALHQSEWSGDHDQRQRRRD